MTYEEIKSELYQKIIVQGKFMAENGLIFPFFMLSAHAIETMGAILDNKPFRTRDQAMFRFNLALRKLYGLHYAKHNEKNFFYQKFRCDLVHLLFPSKHLLLCTSKDFDKSKHLTVENGKLILIAEVMASDNEFALKRLFDFTDKNPTLQKKIIQSWHE